MQRVADGVVLSGDVEIGLCGGKHEEIGTGARGHQLHRLGILLAGNAVSQWLRASSPTQAVVPEQALSVADAEGHAAVAVCPLLELVLTIQVAAHEQRASRQRQVLADVQRQVRAQLVLPHKDIGAIGLGDTADLAVERGCAAQRYRRQVVGFVIAVAPLRCRQRVTCRQRVVGLPLSQLHRLGQRQPQRVAHKMVATILLCSFGCGDRCRQR